MSQEDMGCVESTVLSYGGTWPRPRGSLLGTWRLTPVWPETEHGPVSRDRWLEWGVLWLLALTGSEMDHIG